jgi:DNA-binding transcriptional LysR family regulator
MLRLLSIRVPDTSIAQGALVARVQHTDWLETFVAVVDSGGFSAATTSVHRSQSRVSSHVAALEAALGARLFDRRHRPVQLTDAGEAYLPYAREVLACLRRGQAEVDSVLGVVRGQVVLGSYPSASAAFVPDLLRDFSASHPEVQVELAELATLDLADALNSGRLHLALRAVAPLQNTAGLTHRELWREPLVAVFPPDHPLADLSEPLPLAEVARHELVTIGGLNGSGVQYESHTALATCPQAPRIAWQTDQPQTLVSFVRAGMGVGITNALAMAVSDTAGLRVARVGELEQGRTVGVFWDHRRYMPRAGRALLRAILRAPVPTGALPAGRAAPIRLADGSHADDAVPSADARS